MTKINLIQELDISKLNCTLNNISYSSVNYLIMNEETENQIRRQQFDDNVRIIGNYKYICTYRGIKIANDNSLSYGEVLIV